MGYIRHDVVIVSSWDAKKIAEARAQAVEMMATFANVSEVVAHVVNGGGSFMIAPDGSKEGWDHSDLADEARKNFVDWLNEQRYEDGSTSLPWVEVSLGSDDADDTGITQSWEYRPEPEATP